MSPSQRFVLLGVAGVMLSRAANAEPPRAERPVAEAPSVVAEPPAVAAGVGAEEPVREVRPPPLDAPHDAPNAQPAAPVAEPAAVPPPPTPEPAAGGPELKVRPLGYIEASFSHNFNRPSNGITNYRGFDNRHGTFTLANVALGASFERGPVGGRALFQVGHTPSSYYGAEPGRPSAAGANASGAELWKYVQEAWVSYTAPLAAGLRVQMGLFTSPIGPETLPINENWNWSRSNLFFGLPYYHAGLRATYPLGERWSASVALYNGWNSVLDNNEEKSVAATLNYELAESVTAQLLYFGGIERTMGSREGPYWRHDFDAHAVWDLTSRIAVRGHVNAGWEPNRFGVSSWYGGALYARVRATPWLYVALRGDRFWEDAAASATGSAGRLFWPGDWVSSATATLDLRPVKDHLSVRLEYRHDQAERDTYFRGDVAGDGSTTSPFVPNSTRQDTLTLGATAWF